MADLGMNFTKHDKEPEHGRYFGFHSMEFYVCNAKQAADFYCLRFGFERVAYRGLETQSREEASHVIRQGKIVFVFTCQLNPVEDSHPRAQWLAKRGDSVSKVNFKCSNPKAVWEEAKKRGCKTVQEPTELKDENGSVWVASLESYGGVVHTLVDDTNYKGAYLPGYMPVDTRDESLLTYDPLNTNLLKEISVGLSHIDHCVGNQPDNEMIQACEWYYKYLDFHRFWSVDDKQMHTKYSALRSVVMADFHETIKMPINEPAEGMKKSQIQEYVEYHGGAGVQHIALFTTDIITAVTNLRKRGVKFLDINPKYYENLRKRLSSPDNGIDLKEDINTIEKLNILMDMDDTGYLLQIFTKPVEDRPTLFIEIIQRAGNQGFGVGNFKALFESIEREQERRGNLE